MADKVTWYGHACFLVQTGNTKILIDPFITGNPTSPVKAESVKAAVLNPGEHVDL